LAVPLRLDGVSTIAHRRVKVLTPDIFIMSMSAFCSIPNTDVPDTDRADCSHPAILGRGGPLPLNSMGRGISVTL
jgi:hypothetical protein